MKSLNKIILIQCILLFSDLSYIALQFIPFRILSIFGFTRTITTVFRSRYGYTTTTLGNLIILLPLAYFGWLLLRNDDNELLRSANELGIMYIVLAFNELLTALITVTGLRYQSIPIQIISTITILLRLLTYIGLIIFTFTLDHPSQELQRFRRYLIGFSISLFLIALLHYGSTLMVLINQGQNTSLQTTRYYQRLVNTVTGIVSSILIIISLKGLNGIFVSVPEVEDENLAYPTQTTE